MGGAREMIDELTKRLVDEGKIIEAGWISLRLTVIPKDAPEIQLNEMRTVFFAGAQHLFGSILSMLDRPRRCIKMMRDGTRERPGDDRGRRSSHESRS
jgi:hypothetical protein